MTATGPHRLLFYDYVEGIEELRGPHREAHLARIGRAIEDGGLLAAGAVGDPPTGALFVFGDLPESEVEAFAEGDPYVVAGLVTARRIVGWSVVAAR
jgi:uncharacterized protein YciI